MSMYDFSGYAWRIATSIPDEEFLATIRLRQLDCKKNY
jgi:hypothetical protein